MYRKYPSKRALSARRLPMSRYIQVYATAKRASIVGTRRRWKQERKALQMKLKLPTNKRCLFVCSLTGSCQAVATFSQVTGCNKRYVFFFLSIKNNQKFIPRPRFSPSSSFLSLGRHASVKAAPAEFPLLLLYDWKLRAFDILPF